MPRSQKRHVVPGPGGGWTVREPGGTGEPSVHATQKDAVESARETIRRAGGGEILIHGPDGRIRDADTVFAGPRDSLPDRRGSAEDAPVDRGADLLLDVPHSDPDAFVKLAEQPRKSAAPLIESMRRQIEERLRLQQQLLGVTGAVAAAELSFFSGGASAAANVAALFSLLFVGFALAILRNDQEITVLASHLLNPDEFGEDAWAQASWEYHKFATMQQSGVVNFITTSAQVVSVYGLPILGAIGSMVAAIAEGPTTVALLVLSVTGLFLVLFVGASVDVARRYRQLGFLSHRLLGSQPLDG